MTTAEAFARYRSTAMMSEFSCRDLLFCPTVGLFSYIIITEIYIIYIYIIWNLYIYFFMISRNIMRVSRDTVTSIFSKEFLSLVMLMIVQLFFRILMPKKEEIWFYSRPLLRVRFSGDSKETREPKLTSLRKWTWPSCRFNRFTFRLLFLLTMQLEYCDTGALVTIFLQSVLISSAPNLIHSFHQIMISLAHRQRLENKFFKKKILYIQLNRNLLNHPSLRVLGSILMLFNKKQ